MKISVNLTDTTDVHSDCTGITLPVGSVVILEISAPVYAINDLIVDVRNGMKTAQYRVTQRKLDLAPFLFAGSIEITIRQIENGEEVKVWHVVPIVVKEVQKNFMIFDKLDFLEKEIRNALAAEKSERLQTDQKLLETITELKNEFDEQYI